MALWRVADSSVYIARLLPERYSSQAVALLADWDAQGVQIAAPVLLESEIISVIRKAVYIGRIRPLVADEALEAMREYPIEYFRSPKLLRRAYDLATQFNQPRAYDAQYLAVAEHLGCELWTADERLYNSVHVALPWVKWLGHQTA